MVKMEGCALQLLYKSGNVWVVEKDIGVKRMRICEDDRESKITIERVRIVGKTDGLHQSTVLIERESCRWLGFGGKVVGL
jgi:hypothetical protein